MKQPFQCNLQPEIQEPHGTTHTGTTTRCKTHRRNNSRTKRPQPQPPHRRGTFHRRLQPLYTENTRFRAPASSPEHRACNIHAAIPTWTVICTYILSWYIGSFDLPWAQLGTNEPLFFLTHFHGQMGLENHCLNNVH